MGQQLVETDEDYSVVASVVDGSPLAVVSIVPTVDENSMASLTNVESDRMSEDDDDDASSVSEAYEDGDLLTSAMEDDVTAQLAAAG